MDPNCPTVPDSSVSCRRMVVPTEEARITGGVPPEIDYQYAISGTGGVKLIVTGQIEIGCSEKVQIIPPTVLSSSQSIFIQQNRTEDYIINNFLTDDPNCLIISYRAT